MKRDKYLRVRGGKARMLNISCSQCGTFLLRYQKDGPGNLLRCYLNRIFIPEELEKMQRDPVIREPKHMSTLVCAKCKTVIGTPMRHADGRLAFRLMKCTYSTTIVKGE